MASSRPHASLREPVDHFPGPSSQMLSMHVTTDACASSEMSVERRGVAPNGCDRGQPASSCWLLALCCRCSFPGLAGGSDGSQKMYLPGGPRPSCCEHECCQAHCQLPDSNSVTCNANTRPTCGALWSGWQPPHLCLQYSVHRRSTIRASTLDPTHIECTVVLLPAHQL